MLIERSQVRCPAAAVVSLSKKLYSHCSSPPSCIKGDLAIAGEVNAKLCMSHLMVKVQVGPWVPTPSSMRHVQPPAERQSYSQEDPSVLTLECLLSAQASQSAWVGMTVPNGSNRPCPHVRVSTLCERMYACVHDIVVNDILTPSAYTGVIAMHM